MSLPSNSHTGDESSSHNIGRAAIASTRSALNDNTDAKNDHVAKDGVLAGELFAQNAGVQCAKPRTELEDGCQTLD